MGLMEKLRGRRAENGQEEINPVQFEQIKKQNSPQEERTVRPKPEPVITSRPPPSNNDDPVPKKTAKADADPEKKAAPRVKKDAPPPERKIPEPEKAAPPERRTIPQPVERKPPARSADAPETAVKKVPKPIPKYTGPVTKPPTATAGNISDRMAEVGVIYGNVGTSSFSCRATAHLEKSEYIMAEHEDCGPVLCQVGSLIRKTDLSLEKTLNMNGNTDIQEVISAQIDVVGYRDDRGLLQIPRTTFRAGKPVFKANDALIQSVLGLKMKEKTGAYIGLLHGHGVPVYLDINDLLQRHACILAKTGGGKSYMSGDIIEELMKHNVTCMIIDPHGEYSAMRDVGKKGDARFGVAARGYLDHINEFTVSKTAGGLAMPLRFTLRTLEAREILELTRTNDIRSHLPSLRKAIDALRERQDAYSVRELIDVLSRDEDNKNPMLITELEYLDEIGIFATRGNRVDELIEEGRTTIINLKGVPPDIQELVVRRLGTLMFEMRKTGDVPPMMMIIEEAHNYCPQQGTAISSRALATIASEGRKFGLGLMVISQRPAKIDKNVLSQCGTQIILKVTNPNDVKAIASSVEGLTAGMTEDIQTMPIGIAMVVGAGIEAPLLVDVRPRESRHGGAGVKVLSEDD
jgi:DNA helicase HerA-like ATPase